MGLGASEGSYVYGRADVSNGGGSWLNGFMKGLRK